jgi:asparagine synthase (glutamine-hydrolysing)
MELPQLEPLEISAGVVFGDRRAPAPEVDREWPTEGSRRTLERILLGALERPPCVVAFSGGRDSSAILAEATRIARARGLEDPVPHTLRFAGAPRTAEDEWQELVVRHLDLGEWNRRSMGEELDSLGPIGLDVLRRYGVHWPANIHTFKLIVEPAAGGSLVTGNGGDELFAAWPDRRVALIRRGRAFPRRADLRPLLATLPLGATIARSRRARLMRLPWLTPAAVREVGRRFTEGSTSVARSWAEDVEDYLGSRSVELTLGIGEAIARDAGVHLVEPFYDPAYVRSVCAEAPRDGYASRAVAMGRHFGDLLPAALPGRSTKAVFTEVFAGPETRRFAAEWTGEGLDAALVRPEALRETWLSEVPDMRSLVPLQAAWLATRSG